MLEFKPVLSHMRRKTSSIPKESQKCKQFVNMVRQLQAYNQFPIDFEMTHVSNESTGNDGWRIHQWQMGLLAGVSDYVIFYEGGRVACIEFKRSAKEKQSDKQKWFQDRCIKLKVPYLLTYEIDEAIEFIKSL